MREQRRKGLAEIAGRQCRPAGIDDDGDAVFKHWRPAWEQRHPDAYITTPDPDNPQSGRIDWIFRQLTMIVILLVFLCVVAQVLILAAGVDFVLALPGLLPVVLA